MGILAVTMLRGLLGPSARRIALTLLQLVLGAAVVVVLGLLARGAMPAPPLPPGWAIIRPPDEVSAVVVQGDVVWAGGRDGLWAIDRLTARRQALPAGAPSLRYVKDLLVDRAGDLWVAHDGGVARYDGSVWQSLAPVDGLPAGTASLLEDRQGAIWIGGEQVVVRLDGLSWQAFRAQEGLVLPSVDVLFQDRDGVLWLGSNSPSPGGLASYDGRQWRSYGTRDGLVHPSINAIIQDRSGALWFGTGFSASGGATRLSGGVWRSITRHDGLAGGKVRSIFEDHAGRLWFGSEYDGIAVSDGQSWRVLTPKSGLAGWEVKEMAQDADGVYWLGTEDGLSRIERLE